MIKESDRGVLRRLAGEYAEAAASPVNAEKKKLWRKLNGLKPERPMVMIDQVCWNELECSPELELHCSEDTCRSFERRLRRNLYQWRHFPVDSVMEPFFEICHVVRNSGFGIAVHDETLSTDMHNSVVSHKYENQLRGEEDLDKIKTPVITCDKAATERLLEAARRVFDGILEVRLNGSTPYLSIWDYISQIMPVEDVLYALIDRPEFMHEVARRISSGYLSALDQLENQGLLPASQSLIHCTGAYADELPAPGHDPLKPRCKDIWMFGLAQMFSTVSPDMFEEFEVKYSSPICGRFGLVYYGCCDPLDNKIAQVRKIPNVRKVSMSPWANQQHGAAQIGPDYVFSSKPNPANLAMLSFDPDLVRNELSSIKAACDRNSCPLEFILKDISTLKNHPERLDAWAEIAMDIATA